MKIYSTNAVMNPNPFGATDESEVAAFEKKVGTRLPIDYRTYLLDFNGGEFEKTYFTRDGGVEGCVDSTFGLHSGPEYVRLTEWWKLSKYYDIGEAAPGVNDYLVFADTDTGDMLLLGLNEGAVFFLDHESIEDDPDVGARFSPVPIATSFDAFVESLMPESMIPE